MPYLRLASMEFTNDQTPDKRWVSELKSYFGSEMDVRWNNRERVWYVMRQKRDGRWVGILKTEALDNRVFDALYESDLQRLGVRKYEEIMDNYNNKIDRDRKRFEHEWAEEIAERAWVEKVREHKDFISMAR